MTHVSYATVAHRRAFGHFIDNDQQHSLSWLSNLCTSYCSVEGKGVWTSEVTAEPLGCIDGFQYFSKVSIKEGTQLGNHSDKLKSFYFKTTSGLLLLLCISTAYTCCTFLLHLSVPEIHCKELSLHLYCVSVNHHVSPNNFSVLHEKLYKKIPINSVSIVTKTSTMIYHL